MHQHASWLNEYPEDERQAFLDALIRGARAAELAAHGANAPDSDSQEQRVGPALEEAIAELTQARQALREMVMRQQVRTNTQKLRTSEDPYWTRLRELLRDRGLDLSRTAYVYGFPDDAALEVGAVLTYDSACLMPLRSFHYELTWPYSEGVVQGVFTEWKEITPKPGEREYAEDFAVARAMLLSEAV